MKGFFVLAMLLFNIISPSATKLATFQPAEVAHFFTHSLIAYPELAFAEDNQMRDAYDKDCLTVNEFKSFLTQLYHNNYVIIDIKDTYESHGKTAIAKSVRLPKGKKPIVFSFDDVNYYIKKMHLGMNDKLTIKDGKLATYTQNSKNQFDFDNEHITVLENFISQRPDFSYNGARGILCLTGFDGILGYRTQSGSPNRSDEIEKVSKVVQLLKAKGWRFASHSYGHYHMKKISAQAFANDIRKWKSEVEPLIGKTDIYCYPYGEWEINTGQNLSAKQKTLQDCGFRLFFGVGENNFFSDMPWNCHATEKILLMDRKPIDGISLRSLKVAYQPYFDVDKVYDRNVRPRPMPSLNEKSNPFEKIL